ncbi:MAG: GPW/gp25 family protein [Solirubrobacteraceae bacterium]
MTDLIGSGISFPLQTDERGVLALARGVDDIEQAIRLILGTAPGERPMRPEFGCAVHDLVFDTIDAEMVGRVETAVHRALARWEPRIEVIGLEFDLANVEQGKLEITITYRVRTTSGLYNLVYPFYVIPAEETE